MERPERPATTDECLSSSGETMVKTKTTARTAALNAKLARDCVRQAIKDAVLAGVRPRLITDMRAIAKRLDGAYWHAELMAQRQRRKTRTH